MNRDVAREKQTNRTEESRCILQSGRNSWRVARADRVAFLVDAAAYYEAFAAAVDRAEREVWILGWDFDSRTLLVRGDSPQDESRGAGRSIGPLLHAALERRPELRVNILIWDFALIYAFERDWRPVFRPDWDLHPRIKFCLDDEHPIGACHHQKIVIVDGKIAFSGGMDLSKWRWDTPEHRADDPRRVDPSGKPYAPVHDVQVLVSGEIVACLAEIVEDRWRRATRRRRTPGPTIAAGNGDPWPADVQPDLRDVELSVARTCPPYRRWKEAREIEHLYEDAIAAAKERIYIENQYFSSSAVGNAIARRLQDEEGPEIVLVLPRTCAGWLEESTMGVLRDRLLDRLRRADRFGRFLAAYPIVPEIGDAAVVVHSKLMIVDNTLLNVGSANLANRSMGLDTECDLAIEARGSAEVETFIARFRARLVGEHLGTSPEEIEEALDRTGSLKEVICAAGNRERRLEAFAEARVVSSTASTAIANIADPEHPMEAEAFVRDRLGGTLDESTRGPWLRIGIVVAILVGLAVAWRFTPLGEWLSAESLASAIEGVRGTFLAPLVTCGVFLLGSLVVFPLTLLVLAAGIAFGPWWGFLWALISAVTSSTVNYGIGAVLGRQTVRKLAGSRVNRISRRLAERGILAVAIVRMIPVAPFTVINLVAGASHIGVRDFIVGTSIGLVPGIFAVALLGDRMAAVAGNPGWKSWAILIGVMAGLAFFAWLLDRWFRRRRGHGE